MTAAPKLNLLRLEEDLSAAHLRLSRVLIEHLSWDDCIKRYDRPHTLFYLDPPYWETAGYGESFPFCEYEKIAELMRTMQGKAILSINDHPDIRELFKDFRIEETSLRYTVGKATNRPERGELIVMNW